MGSELVSKGRMTFAMHDNENDPDEELTIRVRKFSREYNLSFAAATREVFKDDPELARRYLMQNGEK